MEVGQPSATGVNVLFLAVAAFKRERAVALTLSQLGAEQAVPEKPWKAKYAKILLVQVSNPFLE
ncbi:hypothetical protein HOLleu_23727 [Holothuria leucospilota]|uniref:Uncharacterized protein n=1 Tax=Holothuria leucospilota TaxID=206669 RepID=A0A9Q1H335_HOLLE|nr:hypothetical protein HOLleu_23727 [Holothuria leucospilota]